ncbi:MAG: DUF1834 family protein [Rubrivivax sp.]
MQMVSQVEDAIVAALRAAATGFSGLRPAAIESYGGQLDDETFEWIRTLPGMWVVFSGVPSKPTRIDTARNKWLYPATFTVFCGQRNLAGNRRLRHGDAHNPGVYALLQIVREALLGQDLGLEIDPFQPGPIRVTTSVVVNRDGVMVYASDWTTKWVETTETAPAEPAGWLDRIGLQYFLKPGDSVADAADVVTTLAP